MLAVHRAAGLTHCNKKMLKGKALFRLRSTKPSQYIHIFVYPIDNVTVYVMPCHTQAKVNQASRMQAALEKYPTQTDLKQDDFILKGLSKVK